MITVKAFAEATGNEPENDDLERVNCDRPGAPGHLFCGWCVSVQPPGVSVWTHSQLRRTTNDYLVYQ